MQPSSFPAFPVILAAVAFAGATVGVSARPSPHRSPAAAGPGISFLTVPTPRFPANISGWVKRQDGRPAVGYTVHATLAAWPGGGAGPNTAVTDGHGWYRINASPATRGNYSGPGPDPEGPRGYSVWVSDGGKPYAELVSGPQTIDTDALPRHRATHVDFVLRSAPPGPSPPP